MPSVYQLQAMYAEDDKVTPSLFPELAIDLLDIFEE